MSACDPQQRVTHTTLYGGVSCKKMVSLLRRLGEISVTDLGISQWLLPTSNVVALQQFWDNVMAATKGPAPHETMFQVY